MQIGKVVARAGAGHDGCLSGFRLEQSIKVFADGTEGQAIASFCVTMPVVPSGNLVQGSDMFRTSATAQRATAPDPEGVAGGSGLVPMNSSTVWLSGKASLGGTRLWYGMPNFDNPVSNIFVVSECPAPPS